MVMDHYQDKLIKYNNMVLKCIFYFKNSWGAKVGIECQHVMPIDAILNARLFYPMRP